MVLDCALRSPESHSLLFWLGVLNRLWQYQLQVDCWTKLAVGAEAGLEFGS